MNVLNKPIQADSNVSATEVAASLQRMMLRLKGKYMSDDGRSVDYASLKNDELYKDFQTGADRLTFVALADLNLNQRKAFFINVYNTLTIHGLCNLDTLPNSLLDVKNFWTHTAYNISGLIFSLDDIEHGILRANTRHPSAMRKPFDENDPRLQYSMKELDPRIHFALNCGGQSCPAIAVYDEFNLETGLTGAAYNFLADVIVDGTNTVHLSKIFSWYGSDFGSNDKEILRWISPYLPESQRDAVKKLLESDRFQIVHNEYNWLINAK